MKQGTRFLAVATPLALSYWLLVALIPQPVVGEFVADLRLVMALLAGLLFMPLAIHALRSPQFREQEAFVVAICTAWLAIGGGGVYSAMAREFNWPMTAGTSAFLGYMVWIGMLAATLHATSLLRGRTRWYGVLGACAFGLALGALTRIF
jgi:hypothetical protein